MKKILFLFFVTLISALSWQGTAQSGTTCDNPLVITSMPFNDSGNTSTYGSNYDRFDVPPLAPGAITNGSTATYNYYLTGDEVVYSYLAGANGSISINSTNDANYVGLFVFTGCPFESTVGYHTDGGGTSRSIPDLPVMAGETYYIVISTLAPPQSTNYTITITGTDVGDPPPFPSPYCDIADSEEVIVEEITKVNFAGTSITNDDDDTVLIDKTDVVVNVSVSGTYTLVVEGNTDGNYKNNIVAFIDWNQNETLDDAGEIYELGTLENSTGEDGVSVTMEISVPEDAVLGETRIRITKTYFDDDAGAIINPCAIEFELSGSATPSFGQALDFTLNIEEANCSGTPDGGLATVDPEIGRINSSYTVSATGYSAGYNGVTYQWQSNTDGAGWVDKGGLENHYVSFSATAPAIGGIEVEWRLEVTCIFSQETVYSDIATFTTFLYCTPELDCTENDMITNVTFQEINNSTTCSPNGYGYYTAMIATVEAGGTYPISVSVGDGWWNESVSIWIDFDGNGIFEEDEFFYIGTGSDQALTGAIGIPSNVADGDYRMRVRVAAVGENEANWFKACDASDQYGETEDYTVTVDGVVVGVDDNSATDFTYYPNPMDEVLYIQAQNDIVSVSVYNVLGQQVISNKNFAEGKIDVSSLPTGTFLFRITFENGQTENFKVLKK